MLHKLNDTGREFVVPDAVLQRALHTTNMEQAHVVMDAFNRERQGYAATRTGHADDPAGRPEDLEWPEWRALDTIGRGGCRHLFTVEHVVYVA